MSKYAQRMLRALILPATIAALSAGTASAQMLSPFSTPPKPAPTPEEIEKQQKLDSDYKSTIRKLPDQKTADPWGDVRPKPSKSAKKKQP